MLVAMRKHTKMVFWIIIILIVPAFIVFYVPSYFQRSGPSRTYGSMFGKTVVTDTFAKAYQAEARLLRDLIEALPRTAYRLPQNRVLGTMREALLSETGSEVNVAAEWRERPYLREHLEHAFTDPETGRYDKATYAKRCRELGMSDAQYLDAFKNDFLLLIPILDRLFDPADAGAQEYMRRFAWRRLVLAHEAERLRIPVSDQDVINYLYFLFPGDGGRFDDEKYGDMLRALRMSRLDYENELRTSIQIATLLRTVLDSAKAPPGEAEEQFNDLYRTFKLAYHLEPNAPYADPKALREDEVLAWYVSNCADADGLKIEPRVAVLYVLIEGKDFEGDVKVEEQDLTAYYEAHRDEFTDASGKTLPYEACQDAVRAAVVGRKAMAQANDEAASLFAVTRTSERLIEVVEQANAHADAGGQDGEPPAHRYELRYTPLFGEKGPIDGTIAEDEESFRSVAFALDLGDVSPSPVRVAQGWCVLTPTRIEPDRTPGAKGFQPFYMARGEARRGAAIDKVKPEILEASREQYTEVRRLMDEEGLGFVAACERQGLALTTTGFLGIEDEEVPGLKDGRPIVLLAAQNREARKAIEEGLLTPEQVYVYDIDEGTVTYDIVESREPSAEFRAREMPWFAERAARRGYVGEVYREWIEALEARAAIVDLPEQDRQRRLQEQQQQQQQPGRGATPR